MKKHTWIVEIKVEKMEEWKKVRLEVVSVISVVSRFSTARTSEKFSDECILPV